MKIISKIYLLGLVIALTQGCGADREAKSSNSEADMISTPAGIEKSKDETCSMITDFRTNKNLTFLGYKLPCWI